MLKMGVQSSSSGPVPRVCLSVSACVCILLDFALCLCLRLSFSAPERFTTRWFPLLCTLRPIRTKKHTHSLGCYVLFVVCLRCSAPRLYSSYSNHFFPFPQVFLVTLTRPAVILYTTTAPHRIVHPSSTIFFFFHVLTSIHLTHLPDHLTVYPDSPPCIRPSTNYLPLIWCPYLVFIFGRGQLEGRRTDGDRGDSNKAHRSTFVLPRRKKNQYRSLNGERQLEGNRS
jgi:hypothetical protein